jgi:spore coat polysaccharide biosynthesis protein SpsF
MKIAILIQARMSSKRLPGKMLMPVMGQPLIQYLIDRLAPLKNEFPIIITTSIDSTDDVLSDYCRNNNTKCYRSDLHSVYQRFVDAIEFFKLDAFVRITGDSPLIDPEIVKNVIYLYRESGADLATNVFPRSFPKGQSIEVFNAKLFCATLKKITNHSEAEHISEFYYKNSNQFKIENICHSQNFANFQMSVDTPEDFANFKALITNNPTKARSATWLELIDSLKKISDS